MRLRRVRRLAIALAGASLMLMPLSPTATLADTVRAAMPSDFNGDGYADLAIGVPDESVGSQFCGAGAVNVLYGSRLGPTASGDQYWHQDSPGVKGRAEGGNRSCDDEGDEFGAALSSGDYDGDGRADLAIGVPFDRVGKTAMAGAVNVLYGTKRGLSASGDQRWSQAKLAGSPEMYDRFGSALASGDFNGDGYWDLAIAVPGEDLAGVVDAGIVQVLYGGPDGLSSTGASVLTRSMTGSPDFTRQVFGGAMAAGDLDGDGRADLAVGAPDISCDGSFCVTTGGDASVFYGTPTGLGADRVELWSQDSPGIEDEAETDDQFGGALAIGDFDGDGFGDLAVGAIYEWVLPCAAIAEPCVGQGAVSVIYGSVDGLAAEGNQFWHEDVPGVPGTAGRFHLFGAALAAGDFDGDGADDLAIGVPYKGSRSQGAVVVLHGSQVGGLTSDRAQLWTQASPGIPSKREKDDRFGSSLASADYGRSGRDDLAIGVAGEEVGNVWGAGTVDVLFGRASGLSGLHAQGWSQNSPGVRGHAETYDKFGWSLTP